jgi:hypothetical protein
MATPPLSDDLAWIRATMTQEEQDEIAALVRHLKPTRPRLYSSRVNRTEHDVHSDSHVRNGRYVAGCRYCR